MDPKAFGPPIWQTMFYIAAGYDVNTNPEKLKYTREFFIGLTKLLPCKTCREWYETLLYKKGYLCMLDVALWSGKPDAVIRFVYDIKRQVSIKLGDTKPVPSLQDVIRYYRSKRNKTTTASSRNPTYM